MEFCEAQSLGMQKFHMFDFKYSGPHGRNLIRSLSSEQLTTNAHAAFFRLEASKMLKTETNPPACRRVLWMGFVLV